MADAHTSDQITFKDRALRIVAVLGLIALLLLGAWGIIQIAFTLYGFMGSVGPSSPQTAQVQNNAITADANANITVKPQGNTSVSAQTPARSAGGSSKPYSSYVPAKTTARTFYGSPDLSVTMGPVTNYGSRYAVQFTIQNVGSNVAPYGWTFNASLPTSGNDTYNSNPQQALNPGDKVVYTLGFDMARNAYSYGYIHNYSTNCGYTTNYTYNGVYNYPGVSYTCTPHNNYGYYGNYYGSQNVTVTVDPTGYVYESSEYNNSATARTY